MFVVYFTCHVVQGLPGRDVQFAEHIGEVKLDRTGRDVKSLCNFSIGFPTLDFNQDLLFPRGQVGFL